MPSGQERGLGRGLKGGPCEEASPRTGDFGGAVGDSVDRDCIGCFELPGDTAALAAKRAE